MKVSEIVVSGGVVGTAEVEEGQDLHRLPLEGRRRREFTDKHQGAKMAALKRPAGDITVRLSLSLGSGAEGGKVRDESEFLSAVWPNETD